MAIILCKEAKKCLISVRLGLDSHNATYKLVSTCVNSAIAYQEYNVCYQLFQ